MVCGDVDCVTWCTLVWPAVNQATGVGVDAEYAALCDKYQDVFQEPGMLPHRQLDHVIDLIDESLPPPKYWQYRLSQAKHAEVKQQVEQLLERGWIRPSVSPYGATILFVQKKMGKLRMCIDYRSLNHQTKLNVFPIPCIADLFDCLGKATVFSSIDLSNAYHQVCMREVDEHKMTF